MGFIKFLFQIALTLCAIVVGFITLGIMLDSPNPWVAFPAAIAVFVIGVGIIGWKFWLVLFGVYKAKEIMTEEEPEEEYIDPEKAEKLRRIDELQQKLDALREDLK